ncbi:hypothetical protein L210DRAFT_3202571 [Boletus edulis BED1]|uniref:Cytoplasmic protein n=1 Tax=Boletus edulis BED1 TaxID=1328754 RepID=A0AAD4GGC1_BOLED|nr:hypothetical protein L210DRAFT_3202571 [Boletus edulis BED1]
MPPSEVSSSRALNAILPLVASGQPYEAHQKARTFASRYSKAGQYDTAIDVLFQSARELLKTGQQGSGTDLALFLLDVYDNKGESVSDESRGRLTQLIALTGSSGSWRKTIIDRAVAWTAKHGPYTIGDPDLHHYIGELLYKEDAYDAAEPHLLASGKRDSARLLAQMMVDWCAAGGIPGHFALRGTLPYLENGNVLAARTFIVQFVNKMIATQSSLASSLEVSPLPVTDSSEVVLTTDNALNFCQLAVLACQRGNAEKNKVMRESWIRLCGTYQSRGGILATNEVRSALLDIATLYFALPPPKTQLNNNPLGAMLSSMLSGGAPGSAPQRRVLTPGLTGPMAPGLD